MQSDDEALEKRIFQLNEAARDGDLSRCQRLVQEWRLQTSPALVPSEHLTPPLAAAVGAKHLAIVAYLLDQGATISGNIMVLALGDTNDAIAMFQTFLEHGWDINSKTDLGNIMLKHIVRNEELTRWFLSHGANPNAYGKPGSTILDVAAANSGPAVFELLMTHGARLEDSDALHSAAGARKNRSGRVEMMAYLLDLGMDVNAIGRREYLPSRRIGRGAPLHAAVAAQEADRIEFLLKRGADVEVRNTLGQTPLEYAIAKEFTTSETTLINMRMEADREGASSSESKK